MWCIFTSAFFTSYALIPQQIDNYTIKTSKQFLLNFIPFYTLICVVYKQYKKFVDEEKKLQKNL